MNNRPHYVIPTYRRYETVKRKTLKTLTEGGVHHDDVTLWVADESERTEYARTVDRKWNIQVAAPTLRGATIRRHENPKTPENGTPLGRTLLMVQAEGSGRKIKAGERQARAVQLRKAGATFKQIAEQLGYSHQSSARKAVINALEKIVAEPAKELLTLELERLDALQVAVWKDATTGHLGAIDRVLRIQERRAKLLGLDKADRSEGPTTTTWIVDSVERADRVNDILSRHAPKDDPAE